MEDQDLHHKFKDWLTILQHAFQTSKSEENDKNDIEEANKLIDSIESTLKADEQNLPSWILRRPSLSQSLVSTADDFRRSLKQICLPNIANRFPSLKDEVSRCQENFLEVDMGPEQKSSETEIEVKTFLSVKLGDRSSVAALCKLADYAHRLGVVQEKDKAKVEALVKKEEKRKEKFEADLLRCQENEVYFQGKDEGAVVHKALTLANDRLKTLDKTLREATEEEEKARKAYELAMQKTKIVRKRISSFESFHEMLNTQAEIMCKVNVLRRSVAEFNHQSAARRLQMLVSLANYMNTNLQSFMQNEVMIESHSLFEFLTSQFYQVGEILRNSANDIASAQESLVLILRIGLETLRVWRGLGADEFYSNLMSEVSGFENFLRNSLGQLTNSSSSSVITQSSDSSQEKPQTIVLYYDKIFHDTPEDHVENQARVSTSLKLLKKRVHHQEESLRSVVLHNCDDIVSPPAWCLPLVHSPQYLSRLADLADEAKKEDLYVPLEFDTEWESFGESSESEKEETDTKKHRRRRSNTRTKKLSYVFDVNNEIGSELGQQSSKILRKILTPCKVDMALANVVSRTESLATSLSRQHAVKSETATERQSTEKSSRSYRVKTPYGVGITTQEIPTSKNGMVKVVFDWGATGYLNASIVERMPSKTTTSRPAPTPSTDNQPDRVQPYQDPSTRYVHTDLKLHKLFRRILDQVKVQRLLLDKIGVKDAILSLWMHGRTSVGVTANVEVGIKAWLKRYDLAKVDALLAEKEQRMLPPQPHIFLEELERLKLPEPPEVYPIAPIRIASMESDYKHLNALPDFSSAEALREDALKYSLARITKKSGGTRVSGPRKPRNQGAQGQSEAASRRKSDPNKSGGRSRGPRKVVWGRNNEPPAASGLSPKASRMSELLRYLMYVLSISLNLNQGSFANDLTRRNNAFVSQTMISSWVRYRMAPNMTKLVNKLVYDWVVFHKRLLAPENLLKFDELVALYEELDALKYFDKLGEDSAENLLVPDVKEETGEDALFTEEMKESMEEEVEEEMDEIPNPNSSFVLEVKAEDHLPDEVAAVDDIAVDEVAVDEEDDGDLRSLEGEAPNSSHAVANSSLVPQHMLFGTQPSDSPPTTDAPTAIDMEMEEMEERPASPLAVEPLPFTPFTSLEISDIDLHAAAMKEIERRHLTHSYTAMEATRVSYRLTQPMLSKFSKDAVLSTTLKARMVRASLVNWLNYSCPRPVSQKDENSFCSNCGKSKFSYPNQLTFLGHVGQCGKIRLDSPAAAHLIKLDEEEEVIEEETRPSRGRKSSKHAQKAQEENDDGDVLTDNDDSANLEVLEDMEKQLDNQIVSILRDTFSLSEPYDRCRMCGELIAVDDTTLRCATCPCVYHVRCAGRQSNESGSVWHCTSCQSKGIEHAEEVLGLDNKSQYCVHGALLFLYVHTDRCWKKAFILGVHSAQPSLVLVKWMDRGQSYKWVDINAVRILKAAKSSSGASEGQRKRRRESITTERNVVNGKRQRTKFSSSVLHAMDGDSDEDSDGRTSRRRSSNGRRTSSAKTNVDDTGIKMSNAGDGMTDTYIGSQSLQAALCTAGSACRAVDLVMERPGSNVFVCTRPPGHHAGRYGCTRGCLSTGFCLLNNAAIALTYARVRYGVQRVAVVDIDVHFGNGTAEILRSDPNAFFASVHMVYGTQNDGHFDDNKDVEAFGFYPAFMGRTEVMANYVSVGIQPSNFSDVIERHSRLHKARAEDEEESEVEVEAEAEVEGEDDDDSIMSLEDGAEAAVPAATAASEEKAKEEQHTTSDSKPSSAESVAGGVTFIGPEGYLAALRDVIIPKMEEFKPELLIISAGFDGYLSDPLGNELKLSLDDYTQSTLMLTSSMDRLASRAAGRPCGGRVISLLEGGYDTSPYSLGLARCVDAHVGALQQTGVAQS